VFLTFHLLIVLLLLLELFFTMLVIAMIAKMKSKPADQNISAAKKENMRDALEANCAQYMLTSREVEILKLLSEGLPYKLIACRLNISNRTVTTHVANMFSKVNVTNKMELVSRIRKE